MTEPTTPQPHKRPFTLKMVCGLLLFRSLVLLPLVTVYFIPEEMQYFNLTVNAPLLEGVTKWVEVTALTVVGFLNLVSAVGLWLFKPWAWRLAMILVGLLLTVELWQQLDGNPQTGNPVGLLLNILIVFYLAQGDIRALFIDKSGPPARTWTT
jgi:uncharacterized membrane protein (DUF2068 family)